MGLMPRLPPTQPTYHVAHDGYQPGAQTSIGPGSTEGDREPRAPRRRPKERPDAEVAARSGTAHPGHVTRHTHTALTTIRGAGTRSRVLPSYHPPPTTHLEIVPRPPPPL
jgi:hypothetical protein